MLPSGGEGRKEGGRDEPWAELPARVRPQRRVEIQRPRFSTPADGQRQTQSRGLEGDDRRQSDARTSFPSMRTIIHPR